MDVTKIASCLVVDVIYVVQLLLGLDYIIVTINLKYEYILVHLIQLYIVTTMSKTTWWTRLFDRPIRGRNQQYYDFGLIFSGAHFVFMQIG